MTYQPRPYDIEWLRKTLNLLSDGGLVAYPRSMLCYRVNHKLKTLTLTNPSILNEGSEWTVKDHQATIAVAARLNYTVIE